MKERIYSLDVLRVLAIFLVSAYHIARFLGFENINVNAFELGWMGCGIFFVISGYFANSSLNKEGGVGCLKRRLIRIYPPYIIALCFWLIAINCGIAVKPAKLWDIFTHLTLTHNLFSSTFYSISGVFWFLATLFDLYLFFYLFGYKFRKNGLIVTIICLVSFLTMTIINIKTGYFKSPLTKSILTYLPAFYVGVALNMGKFRIKNKFLNLLILLCSISALLFLDVKHFCQLLHLKFESIRFLYEFLISSTLVISTINLFEHFKSLNKECYLKNFIIQISQASYSIYLYNYIFYATTPVNKDFLTFLIYLILVWGFGYFTYIFIEKPIGKFIANKSQA